MKEAGTCLRELLNRDLLLSAVGLQVVLQIVPANTCVNNQHVFMVLFRRHGLYFTCNTHYLSMFTIRVQVYVHFTFFSFLPPFSFSFFLSLSLSIAPSLDKLYFASYQTFSPQAQHVFFIFFIKMTSLLVHNPTLLIRLYVGLFVGYKPLFCEAGIR